MKQHNRFARYLPPVILAFFLMAVYIASMAPGLTWANFGADGGDLIAAAASGGIAHPSGYPLYLLLARIFQRLPIGTLAYRTNLMSAFAAASAALLVYGLVRQSLISSNLKHDWWPALAAAVAFGLSPLIWSQAVITEVYTLHAFFVALLLYLSINPLSVHFTRSRQDFLLGLTFGLAMGNHLTTILFLPVILFTTASGQPDLAKNKPKRFNLHLKGVSLMRRMAWAAGGLLIYLTLPLRALAHPPVNWGNPVTLNGFIWLVSGKLYQGLLLSVSIPFILERIQNAASLLLAQFGVIGLAVGLAGLIMFHRPTRLNYCLLWVAFISSAFAIVYATPDAFMYLIPAFLCFAIWIGNGLGGLIARFSKGLSNVDIFAGMLMVMLILIQAWGNLPRVNAAGDLQAESFGRSVLASAPAHALVFVQGDEAIFALWYFQFALTDRPDLAIVANDLLGFDWYLQTLRSTYPDLNLPGPFPFAETVVLANPGRPVCHIQYVHAPVINCLPALDPQSP